MSAIDSLVLAASDIQTNVFFLGTLGKEKDIGLDVTCSKN